MNIGTITPGGTQHLAGELFRSSAGIDALVIPHKTTGEVIIAARNGNVDLGGGLHRAAALEHQVRRAAARWR